MTEAANIAINRAALIPWGDLIEDFLDGIDVSLHNFCREMTGGWLFGYVEAMKLIGIQSVIFCVSARVASPVYQRHIPSGAIVCILPATKNYRAIRRRMIYPYGWSVRETFGKVKHLRFWSALKDIAPYLSTPVWLLSHELRRMKCRLIICQEYEYPRFDVSTILGKILQIPVVATFQGGTWHLSRLERLVRPFSMSTVNGLIVQTQIEMQRIRLKYNIYSNRIARIFNPIDLKAWPLLDRDKARERIGINKNIKVCIWHGRIDINRKGLDILLDAWSLICKKDQKKKLLIIIGNGVDQKKFGRRLKKFPPPNIDWIDEYILNKKTIHTYLSAADVFMFSSRHEGFPVAPIEAMACGLPVVASNAPGISDIFEKGEKDGGIVVPIEDAEKLAASVKRIFNNPDLGFRLGIRSRQRVIESFTTEAVANQMADFFSNIQAIVKK